MTFLTRLVLPLLWALQRPFSIVVAILKDPPPTPFLRLWNIKMMPDLTSAAFVIESEYFYISDSLIPPSNHKISFRSEFLSPKLLSNRKTSLRPEPSGVSYHTTKVKVGKKKCSQSFVYICLQMIDCTFFCQFLLQRQIKNTLIALIEILIYNDLARGKKRAD